MPPIRRLQRLERLSVVQTLEGLSFWGCWNLNDSWNMYLLAVEAFGFHER